MTSGSPRPRLPRGATNTVVARGYRGPWAELPLPGLPPVTAALVDGHLTAARAAWEHALTARETLVRGCRPRGPGAGRRAARGGLRPVHRVRRPVADRGAPARRGPALADDQRQHRTTQARRAHPAEPDDRRRGPAAPALAVPLRPGCLRVVAGRHAVTGPPRPGRRVRRAGRARHLARPGPGRGRDRRVGNPDVLAPGAARGGRDRGPAAARAGHPGRRAGGPVDPGPAHRPLPGRPRLVDLRLQRGGREHRRPRRPGRLPGVLAGPVRAGTAATVRGRRRAADRVRLERRRLHRGAAHR